MTFGSFCFLTEIPPLCHMVCHSRLLTTWIAFSSYQCGKRNVYNPWFHDQKISNFDILTAKFQKHIIILCLKSVIIFIDDQNIWLFNHWCRQCYFLNIVYRMQSWIWFATSNRMNSWYDNPPKSISWVRDQILITKCFIRLYVCVHYESNLASFPSKHTRISSTWTIPDYLSSIRL
jgi:hypothetical protein